MVDILVDTFKEPIHEFQESATRYLSHCITLVHRANHTIRPSVRNERQKASSRTSFNDEGQKSILLEVLEEELPNLLLAIERARQLEDRSGVCKLADELSTFLNLRSHWSEWLAIAELAAKESGSIPDPKVGAIALNNLAVIYRQLERYKEAVECSQKSLSLCLEIGDRYGEGLAYGNLAGAHFALGESHASLTEYEKTLNIFTELGDLYEHSQSLLGIGMVMARSGNLEEAVSKFNACLEVQREIGDEFGEAQTLNNLGIALRTQGNINQAIQKLQSSIRIKNEIGDRQGIVTTLNNLAVAYQQKGELDLAIVALEEALVRSGELNPDETERITERLIKVREKLSDTSTSK